LRLDTELIEDELRRTARIVRASEYAIGELREIYLFEVVLVVC
jgi:hypothetical protein